VSKSNSRQIKANKMSRSAGVHDTLVYRLSQVLTKLNQGESLDPQTLADEFGVTLRTIQRDLNVRFACLPLVKTDGRYRLEQSQLGKLTAKDIERFAALSGVEGLFPQLSERFLRGIFGSGNAQAWLVRGHHYEDLRGKEALFAELEQAIVEHRHLQFTYTKSSGDSRFYDQVEPYKLINHKGIWYLAAWDGNRLKSFSVTKVSALRTGSTTFSPRAEIDTILTGSDSLWIGNKPISVMLHVARRVASYFKRRDLLPNQVIKKELNDGDLLIETTVGHPDEILPIVRYWIPHVRIVEPRHWQEQMEASLAAYMAPQAGRK